MAGPSRHHEAAARPDNEARTGRPAGTVDERYRWVALANTTASVFMSALDDTTLVFNT